MAKYGNWFENAKEVLGKLASWSANGQEIDSDLTVTQVFTVEGGLFVDGDTVSFSNLRTTESGIAGELWSNNGVVTVSGS